MLGKGADDAKANYTSMENTLHTSHYARHGAGHAVAIAEREHEMYGTGPYSYGRKHMAQVYCVRGCGHQGMGSHRQHYGRLGRGQTWSMG